MVSLIATNVGASLPVVLGPPTGPMCLSLEAIGPEFHPFGLSSDYSILRPGSLDLQLTSTFDEERRARQHGDHRPRRI